MAIRKPRIKTSSLKYEHKREIVMTEADAVRLERCIGAETKKNKVASIATKNELSDKVLSD